jgi:4'-phosphopantetheinyl transferase
MDAQVVTSTEREVARVYVWTWDLDRPPVPACILKQWLADDEVARAQRYRFPADRLRYITGRGLLRWMLGRRLRLDPRDVEFRYGAQGKPHLASAHRLEFNVSHSENILVAAIASGARVGVDVEVVRPLDDADTLVREVLCERERRQLADPSGSPLDFYRFWTAKEALLKATGMGLSSSPRDVQVRSFSDGRIAFAAPLVGATGFQGWLLDVAVPGGSGQATVAAVVIDRPGRLRVRQQQPTLRTQRQHPGR